MNQIELKNKIISYGASLVGFADVSDVVPDNFKDFKKAISIAVKLSDDIIDKIKNGPTKMYANHYREINKLLNNIGKKVVRLIEKNGYKAVLIKASKSITHMRGEFPHKTAATKAGLGWIGKSALLITYKYGPRVRLVTVLTNMSFDIVSPVEESECGNCSLCVKICPVKAIKNKNWNLNMNREDFFDAESCNKETLKNKEKLGEKICGMCISVCPKGKK